MKIIKMIVGFAIGFLLMIGIFSFLPKNSETPLAEVAESFVLRTEVEELVKLRDSLKPDSQEAHGQTYETITWTPEQRSPF